MKILIFTLLLSFHLSAQTRTAEVAGSSAEDQELSRKLVSVVKDVEIGDQMVETQEFRECREKNKYQAGTPPTQTQVEAMVTCFKQKLDGRDATQLKDLADELNLQGYKLIPSDNVKEITKYLGNRMYKTLSGVDLEERNKQQLLDKMKFKNSKMIDQKLFAELYRAQLSKNALLELSRFCFENLRRADQPEPNQGQTFVDYWGGPTNLGINGAVTDVGSTRPFGSQLSTGDKKDRLESIARSMDIGASGVDPQKLSDFYQACSRSIGQLCKDYELRNGQQAGPTDINLTVTTTKGANSCLTKARLQAAERAVANASKVIDDFGTMDVSTISIALRGELPETFVSGENGNPTLDKMTNFSSADVVGDDTSSNAALETRCINTPNDPECERFTLIGDQAGKAAYETDVNMRLRQEVEMARIKKIVDTDRTKLLDYLKENGYTELAKMEEEGANLNPDQWEEEMRKVHEARRKAALAAINTKAGSRQITETDAGNQNQLDQNIQANARSAQQERQRMAQVIMFNNIITSKLDLSRRLSSGGTQSIGRNTGASDVEAEALSQFQVQPDLFANLQSTTGSRTPANNNTPARTGNEVIEIDTILDLIKE